MKLEPKFVTDVMQILYGRIPDSAETALRAKRLDSIEEFLAWILLRQDMVTTEPEISEYLSELGRTQIVKAETPRQKSGFDIESPQSFDELSVTLRDVIKADENTYQEHNKAQNAMVRFAAARDSGDHLLRFKLDIM